MKPKDKGSADWNLWADMEEVQLWQAVALSLDIEPNSLPGLDFRPIVGGPFDDCPDEFKRRLKLAVSKFYEANTEIRLSSLREWAVQLTRPWTFPKDFPQQQPTIKEAAKSAPIAVEQGQKGLNEASPQPASHLKPWLESDPSDPDPKQDWYIPARYFARQLIKKDSTLLLKRVVLADMVSKSLAKLGIYKRGGKKPPAAETILKAFSNVILD